MKKIFLTFMVFVPLVLVAQTERIHEFSRFRYGVEIGLESFAGDKVDIPQIRENQSSNYYPDYYDDMYYCGYMYDRYNYTHFFVGFKPEYSLNHFFVASAGLRLSFNNSFMNSDRNYFLWKVAESGQMTNYVRVTNLTQNNFYIGLPMDIKIFTYKRDVRFQHYFKAGFVFNTLVASATKVNFQNPAMEKPYSDQIAKQLKKPSFFSAQTFVGMGFKI